MLIHRRDVMKGIGASAFAMSTPFAYAQQATPRRGGTLTVGIVHDNTKTLDPRLSFNTDERQSLFLIYDGLLAVDQGFVLKPDLAKSWTIENSGKRYVFTLQEGVKFQDGTPFNAEAVKWNIEQRLDEKVKSSQRPQLLPVIASVEVLSSHVVAVNLNYPYPSLLADFADRAGLMVSPTASEKYGQEYGRNPVGTGAFTLKQWVQGTNITLARNPDYWRKGEPHLDAVVFRTVPNAVLGMQRISIGEVDLMAGLGPNDIRQLDATNAVALKLPVGRWYALQWQVDKPPFNNATLRRAIAHSIDRDRLNQIIFDGKATIANSMSAPGLWYSKEVKPLSFEYSQDKARALLKESGWKMDEPITLWAPGEATYNKISQLVGEQLGAVGFKVNMSPIVQSEYYSRVVQRVVSFTPTAWAPRVDPDGLYYFLLHTKGTGNSTGYNSPKADQLLEQARTLTDQTERAKLYGEVQELLMQDIPYIPLFFSAEYTVVSKKVQNWQPSPDTFPRLRAASKTA